MRIYPTTRALTLFACFFPAALLALLGSGFAWIGHVLYLGFAIGLVADLLLLPGRGALAVSRRCERKLMQGETATLETELRSTATLPVLVELWEDNLPTTASSTGFDDHEARLLPPAGTVTFERKVEATRRGLHVTPGLMLRIRTRMGLLCKQWRIEDPIELAIYPDTSLLPRAMLLARTDPASLQGPRRLRSPEEGMEFESLREYQIGDDPRHIEWKVSARQRHHVVKTYQVQRGQQVFVAVDCGRLMATETRGVSKLDRAIEAALLLCGSALSRADSVGLATFSSQLVAFVRPDRRPAHMNSVLEAVFSTQPLPEETNFARSLGQLRSRLRKRTLILLFSDFTDSLSAADMVEQLRHISRHHRVVFIGVRDPYLDETLKAPLTGTSSLQQKVAAVTLERDRHVVLSQLRHAGMEALDLSPGNLNEPTLNAYLQLTAGRKLGHRLAR